MAHTIMVSNKAYALLKRIKKDESFSEVILELAEKAHAKKGGSELAKFFGALKKDKEYDKVLKDVRKEWASWTKKYA